ncbi:MAG: hypothetical protein P4L46_19620 [Fimbriimonas sp.]|nr:hypothetical protein [Fimbriimonas sp.]
MRKTIFSTTVLVLACSGAYAQAIKVGAHEGASDVWGSNYNSGLKLTFSGRVTGIVKTRPEVGKDNEVTLLVRNKVGGTYVVDVGPTWFVDHQVAKLRVKDTVQVTGSKVMVKGHGIVLASQIRVNGQGGLVVSLRRPSGRAYWMGTEIAENLSIPTGPNVLSGNFTGFGTYTLNNVPYASGVLQTPNGPVTVDLGPQWYYNQQNAEYHIGDGVWVVTGPSTFTVGQYGSIYPSYSIYRGPQVYTIRDENGQPTYYWGQ